MWGFLYDIKNLPDSSVLKAKCITLQETLVDANTGESDVNGQQLCDEMMHFQALLKNTEVETPAHYLNFILKNNMEDCFPNTWICLRILLTIPISVASGERSFSKLKLIKTYLRSTMTQERLSALAIISIESDIARSLDLSSVIEKFAESKARRGKFK